MGVLLFIVILIVAYRVISSGGQSDSRSKADRYGGKHINEAIELKEKFVAKSNFVYKNEYGTKEWYQGIQEIDWLAEDMVFLYVRRVLEGDYESSKVLMNTAEKTSHYYRGEKYNQGLLEDIMREELSKSVDTL